MTPAAPESASAAPISEPWVGPQMGKRFTTLYVQRKDCKGHFDVVKKRYTGIPSGFDVEGWAWDGFAKRPVTRVVFVDEKDLIFGGGHGGRERPDVPDVVKDITSKMTGWYGTVRSPGGVTSAYAILDGGDACLVGTMNLGS